MVTLAEVGRGVPRASVIGRAVLDRTGRLIAGAVRAAAVASVLRAGSVRQGAAARGPALRSMLGWSLWPTVRPLGSASPIPMPDEWAAVPLPVGYIGYGLAALAIARGAVVVVVLGGSVLIDGRQLIANDGRLRNFATDADYRKWRAAVLADLAAAVGGLAVWSGADRALWVSDFKADTQAHMMSLMGAIGKARVPAIRAALAADAEWLMTRL